MVTEKDVKKAYSSPSLKKWGSVKDLTAGGQKEGTPDSGASGSTPYRM
jgi:hypothetical protein